MTGLITVNSSHLTNTPPLPHTTYMHAHKEEHAHAHTSHVPDVQRHSVTMHLFGLQGLSVLIIAHQPETGDLVVLVICYHQVICSRMYDFIFSLCRCHTMSRARDCGLDTAPTITQAWRMLQDIHLSTTHIGGRGKQFRHLAAHKQDTVSC